MRLITGNRIAIVIAVTVLIAVIIAAIIAVVIAVVIAATTHACSIHKQASQHVQVLSKEPPEPLPALLVSLGSLQTGQDDAQVEPTQLGKDGAIDRAHVALVLLALALPPTSASTPAPSAAVDLERRDARSSQLAGRDEPARATGIIDS